MTVNDLLLAFRLIRQQPVLTLTAILALATGIGLATTGFTFLEAGLRAVLPFPGGDRFVMVDAYEEPNASRITLTADRMGLLAEGASAASHLGAHAGAAQNLMLPTGEVVLVGGIALTPTSFAVLPYRPVLGRTLAIADALPGAGPVVLIRESLWRRHFSGDAAIIGQHANFSGVLREIVGVMPDSFEFPNSPEVWLPLTDVSEGRTFGVLADAGGLALAQEQLTALSAQYEASHPAAPKLRLRVLPYVDALSQGVDILAAAVVLVLLLVLVVIAANVANLVLARTMARSSELAVRSALGATRGRLVGQVFTEVLVLGAIAAGLGVLASRLIYRWIDATLTDMPFWITFDAGPWTTAFVALATVLAAAIGGAWPAWRATRRDPATALATSNRRIAGGLGLAGSVMIALQVSLSIAALYAALVVARGVSGYMEGASTPNEERVITVRLFDETPSADENAELLEAIRRLPGVEHAALATSLPRLSPAAVMTSVRSVTGTVSAPRPAPRVAISARYVEVLGSHVTAGRAFTVADTQPGAHPVAIVNEPFVMRFLGGRNPLGQHVRFVTADDDDGVAAVWREIVGVVPDLGLSAGDEDLAGGVYVPLGAESFTYLAVSTTADPEGVGRMLPRAIGDIDPSIQARDVLRLPDVGREDRAVFAGIGAALTTLGAVALALSVMGVYAMLSFAVTARTRELAIRSALGASRLYVLRSLIGSAAVPLLVGASLGPVLGSAIIAARGIFVFRLPAEAGAGAILLLIIVMSTAAALALFIPARRALSISTAEALRTD